jgi:hypothetical protein
MQAEDQRRPHGDERGKPPLQVAAKKMLSRIATKVALLSASSQSQIDEFKNLASVGTLKFPKK